MLSRYTASFGPALLVTVGLVLVMQLMIATGRPATTEAIVHRFVDFVRIERTPVPTTERERLEPPPPPPMRPERTDPIDERGTGPVVRIDGPGRPELGSGERASLWLPDGQALAIARVAPRYPAAALRRELEGYVIVEFTVLRSGAVADVVVLESTDSIFERAAIEAVERFRYKPQVVDGEAVPTAGIRTKLTFELE